MVAGSVEDGHVVVAPRRAARARVAVEVTTLCSPRLRRPAAGWAPGSAGCCPSPRDSCGKPDRWAGRRVPATAAGRTAACRAPGRCPTHRSRTRSCGCCGTGSRPASAPDRRHHRRARSRTAPRCRWSPCPSARPSALNRSIRNRWPWMRSASSRSATPIVRITTGSPTYARSSGVPGSPYLTEENTYGSTVVTVACTRVGPGRRQSRADVVFRQTEPVELLPLVGGASGRR